MGKTKKDSKSKAKATSSRASSMTRGGGGSDHESEASDLTHVTLADDLESVAGDGLAIADDAELPDNLVSSFQTSLQDNLENALEKNNKVKKAALKNLQSILSRYILPDLLLKYRTSIEDVVDKVLRKGHPEDAMAALRIFALVSMQLGAEISDEVSRLLVPLRTQCADESLTKEYRAVCAHVIGLACFVAIDEIEPLEQSLATLRTVWQSTKSGNVEVNAIDLFTAAVESYSLILGQMPSRAREEAINKDLPKLCQYLENNQVEIRISTGETIALIYEMAKELYSDVNWHPPNHQQTLNRLDALANDAMKFRAKKDRRTQRSTFRQLQTAIKEGGHPEFAVKFGQAEELVLQSWSDQLTYNTICSVLRSATPVHLAKNNLLRNIFDLGPAHEARSKAELDNSKSAKQAIYAANEKNRQQTRGKQRSKRLDSFSTS